MVVKHRTSITFQCKILGLETFKNVIQLRNLEITIIDYIMDIQHEELKQYIRAGEKCQKKTLFSAPKN